MRTQILGRKGGQTSVEVRFHQEEDAREEVAAVHRDVSVVGGKRDLRGVVAFKRPVGEFDFPVGRKVFGKERLSLAPALFRQQCERMVVSHDRDVVGFEEFDLPKIGVKPQGRRVKRDVDAARGEVLREILGERNAGEM